MKFIKTRLKEILTINHIISLHYFEFSKDYIFKGEKHDFWEFLYVDKGEAEILADTEGYKLNQGDIIFHKPNEFHSVRANQTIAPNLIVISFECKSAAMAFFEKKIFCLDLQQRELLAQVVRNGFLAFSSPLDEPSMNTLVNHSDAPAGTEQLIKIYLELLLLNLFQVGDSTRQGQRLSYATKERSENDLVTMMTVFMEQHVDENLTLDQICKSFNLSKSHAVTLYREKTGQSIMKYFKIQKIVKAKKMIREEKYNFSQISTALNYSTIHNFSRHFKTVTSMSPSEYAKSIKAKLQ